MTFSLPLDPDAIAAYHRSQEPLGEPWEVSYGYIGKKPEVIQCWNEAEAEALFRELPQVFPPGSHWKISARRLGS